MNDIAIKNELELFLKEFATKDVVVCKACNKSYSTEASLRRHQEKNLGCKHWLSVNKEKKEVIPQTGIHMLVNKLLDEAITGEEELQCRYCKIKFASRGNQHKHFYTSTVCNCLAFNEFKRLICEQ
jgi:hypothetical protein